MLFTVQQDDAVLKYNGDNIVETITRPTKILGMEEFWCDSWAYSFMMTTAVFARDKNILVFCIFCIRQEIFKERWIQIIFPLKDFGNKIYIEMDCVIGLSTQKYII